MNFSLDNHLHDIPASCTPHGCESKSSADCRKRQVRNQGRKFFRNRALKLRSDFVLTAFQDAKPFLILIVARVLSH